MKKYLNRATLATAVSALCLTAGVYALNKCSPIEETVTGLPVLVSYDNSVHLIIDKDGAYQSCVSEGQNNLVEANYLIQSEIDDGDKEDVILEGNFKNGVFYFHSVSANGYEINLKKQD